MNCLLQRRKSSKPIKKQEFHNALFGDFLAVWVSLRAIAFCCFLSAYDSVAFRPFDLFAVNLAFAMLDDMKTSFSIIPDVGQ